MFQIKSESRRLACGKVLRLTLCNPLTEFPKVPGMRKHGIRKTKHG